MDQTPTSDDIELQTYLRPLKRWAWLIVLITVAAAALGWLYESHKAKEYTASTQVFVQESQLDQTVFGQSSASLQPGQLAADEAVLVQSNAVAQRVARSIGYTGDPQGLLGDIAAVPASNSTDFVQISARAKSPAMAAALANAFAHALVDVSSDAEQAKVRTARSIASGELARLPRGPAQDASRRTLRQQIAQFDAALNLTGGTAQQVDPAVAPSSPSNTSNLRSAIFGGVVGLLLAIGIVLLLNRLDRRVRSAEEFAELYRTTLLATVPHSQDIAPVVDEDLALDPSALESFRALRTNINLATLDHPVRSLLVTSAVPTEGKTTIARNLALAFTEAGQRVALVESDLRRPSFPSMFRVPPSPGLTDLVVGSGGVASALHTVPSVRPAAVGANLVVAPDPSPTNGSSSALLTAEETNGGVGRLSVLTSGSPAANPPGVLGSTRLHEVLSSLTELFDLVIVDTPPMLPVSDTLGLLNAVDGVVVVARLGYTKRDDASRARAMLDRAASGRLLGLVANDARGEQAGYGQY